MKTENTINTIMFFLAVISFVFAIKEVYNIALIPLYMVLILNIISMGIPDEN